MNDIAKMIAIAKKFGGSGSTALSEVVILPETEFEIASQGQPAYIREPLSATPTNGATAKVSYNGTEYMCWIAHAEDGGTTAFAIGNFDAMGLPVPGGNPTAPFVAVLYEAEENGAYGMIVSLEDVSTVTLSIVQVGAASGGESAGGGIFEVNVSATSFNASTGHDFSEFDKTFAELVAAQNAGKYVRINVSWNVGVSSYGNVILYGDAGDGTQFIVSMPQSYTTFRQTTYYILTAGENGEIVTQLIGAD